MKRSLPIVSAVTAVDVKGKTVLLVVHEAVHNEGVPCSLLSDFQLKECVQHELDATFR